MILSTVSEMFSGGVDGGGCRGGSCGCLCVLWWLFSAAILLLDVLDGTFEVSNTTSFNISNP